MGMRMLLGGVGTDKSRVIREDIKQRITEAPQGPPIFYIVPDQMTFQEEYALFDHADVPGSIRAQVMSFSRLAWRVLQETGGGTRQFISSIGIQMMLRKIMEERAGEWRVFQKAKEKQGFLERLEALITEFKRYLISPDMLKAQIDEMNRFKHQYPTEEALTDKLEDLVYIYDKLVDTLHGHYIDGEDQLQLLAEKISHTHLFDGADIYLDGFHSFSPKELLVIEQLLKSCRRVTIALTMDNVPERDVPELDIFYQTKRTYNALKTIAEENGIEQEDAIVLDPKAGRFKDRPYFAHLEAQFDVRPPMAWEEGRVPIQIAEAVHPRAEVEGVAQEIVRLVRDERYRYRDIAIFMRQADVYHDLIDTVFRDHDIPVFIDEKRSMLNHPLIEMLRSVLDVVEGNWRYDAIFRVLKTGFIPSGDTHMPLSNDAIDELENYVLEYGIRSRTRWLGENEWVFQRFRGFDGASQTDHEKNTQKRINAYRHHVVNALGKFDQGVREADTVRAFCEQLYDLMETLDVPSRLEEMRTFYDEEGMIERGREQEQVWQALIQLLDEMVEMAGDEQMTLSTFKKTIEAGLETLTFAHVPPSMDHVIVGTIDRSRISGIKCAFLLGVNDGIWPMKPPADGMINEEERLLLSEHGIQLADGGRRELLDDWFYMYAALTVASDKLWVSYPLSDEEGKSKTPSPLIHRLDSLFPNSCDHLLLQDPDELFEADRFITTPLRTRAALTAQLARYRKTYPIKPIWWHVLNWYIENTNKGETTYSILQSLYYDNTPVTLSKETTESLYDDTVKASVSRLETHYRCSYQHFAQYSLGLKERQTYKLDAPDIGQLFHEALKKITEWVQGEGRHFKDLTREETGKYAERAVTELAPVLQHQILHSSNRYLYIQKKLRDVIARATHVLSEQARYSDFSPVGLELGFGTGHEETLPALTLPLANGYQLMLRGRIDRVDQAIRDEHLYLRIIDYKSSAKGLNLLDVYYGLALQMLAYLDVILTHSEQWLGRKATPAGVLYFHVHNPLITGKTKMSDEAIIEEIFKQYKMQGLLLADESVVQMMDTSLASGRSQIVPAGVKKNGGFYNGSKIADPETFAVLQSHIHQLMTSAGVAMTSGSVELNPYQHKQQTPCTFCPFLSVCQFDPSLEDNQYRKLQHMSDDDIIDLLRRNKEGLSW
ncbi:helicase-exonuclease AddAB subunit AddB [Lentibacillus saliphilus]|uniref:helicase-exonuclease AddAB subunit AddB n=1 Tax=Lentibacillus saliphilus TaxID=2737028 RepID=UPI001C311686|nr:helicase-exonuclease AddAB subunit AddB [Lentibacillus saliphilus]